MAILHDGVKINLGGREFVMPPLTLKHLRLHGPIITGLQAMTDVPDAEQCDGILTLLTAALSRNYPDLTREDLEDLVDVVNLKPAFLAMVGQSGMTQVKAGEVGEVTP